jgi:hypothetical protein
MATADEYVDAGRTVIERLIDRENAIVYQELVAKAADRPPADAPPGIIRIDPHHLNAARKQLLTDGAIVETTAATRGQRPVTVMHRPLTPGVVRAIQDAAAHKRALYGRYLSWASGSPSRPSITAAAAERAVHASILEAAPTVGLVLSNPNTGQTDDLFGMAVPHGPLDNGLRFFDYEARTAYLVPVEVKNLRDWIYPADAALHQLLAKASALQAEHPDQPILPVLVCRRAQRTALRLAKDLGFHIVDTYRQYILPSHFHDDADQQRLFEIQDRLGFFDLRAGDGAHARVVKQFREVIPAVVAGQSHRWSIYGPRFVEQFNAIREDPSAERRQELLGLIREEMRGEPDPYTGAPSPARGW